MRNGLQFVVFFIFAVFSNLCKNGGQILQCFDIDGKIRIVLIFAALLCSWQIGGIDKK